VPGLPAGLVATGAAAWAVVAPEAKGAGAVGSGAPDWGGGPPCGAFGSSVGSGEHMAGVCGHIPAGIGLSAARSRATPECLSGELTS
jgi:hypothetical protein